MSDHGSGCEDCVRCTECQEIAYCLSEPGSRPCPHDRVLCGECLLDHCPGCRLEAEQEMHRSGVYSPEADPFFRPEREAADAAYWDRTGSTFDPVTNSHRRRAEEDTDAELARLLDVEGAFQELNDEAERRRGRAG